MTWHHLIFPHKETHKKAHLISWRGLLSYILIFILLQVSFSLAGYYKPGVLGVTSQVEQKRIIELTNIERQKNGLEPVVENASLDEAAKLKAANMFSENYWAHFAPSGKTPWDFILGSGYKFSYAGENLAKNFYTSEDVVSAWMASPTHKENIVNPKYQEIGIAVVEGTLNGQKTTLVVQMFGTSQTSAALPQVRVSGQDFEISKEVAGQSFGSINPQLIASIEPQKTVTPLFDPYQTLKFAGIAVLGFASLLLILDFMILRKRGVVRPASHHFANLSFVAAGVAALINIGPGNIL